MALDVSYTDGRLVLPPELGNSRVPAGAIATWAVPLPFEAGYQQSVKRSFVTPTTGHVAFRFPAALVLPENPEGLEWVTTVHRLLLFIRGYTPGLVTSTFASITPRAYGGPNLDPDLSVLVLQFPKIGLWAGADFNGPVEVTAVRAGLIAYLN